MKNKGKAMLTIAVCAAVIAVSGCNKQESVTTAASAQAAETTPTAAATETTATTEAPQTVETTAPAETEEVPATEDNGSAEPGDLTLLYSTPDGEVYYLEGAEKYGDWQISYGRLPVRISTGMYFDSEANPDLFSADDFIYVGEKAPVSDIITVREGDTIAGHEVTEAFCRFFSNSETGDIGEIPNEMSLTLSGDITLTGTLRYFSDDQ